MYRVCLVLFFIAFAYAKLSYHISALEEGNVLCTLSNLGDTTESFLTYSTPFDQDIYASVLSIKNHAGEEVKYIGKIGKRVFPAPEEAFLTLKSGESISAVINVHEHYNLMEQGIFTVSVRVPSTLVAVATGSIVKFFERSPERVHVKASITYQNCNDNRKSIVSSHATTAEQYAFKTKKCLEENSCDSYSLKWFSATSSQNSDDYKHVSDVYEKLAPSLSKVEVDCEPTDCGGSSVYAYVFPTDPNQLIYLCDAFWSTSDDSERTQTFIHEKSHFEPNGGTLDTAYGRVECQSLALINPRAAARNADNIGYFAVDVGQFVDITYSEETNSNNNSPNSSNSPNTNSNSPNTNSNNNSSRASTILPGLLLLFLCLF